MLLKYIISTSLLTFCVGAVDIINVPENFTGVLNETELESEPNIPLVRYRNNVYFYQALLKGDSQSAKLFCSYLNMKLLYIENCEEDEFLQRSLKRFIGQGEPKFWTSGVRFGNGWVWDSTGTPVRYTNWMSGEPNNAGGNENCIEMPYYSSIRKFAWNDAGCSSQNYIICKSKMHYDEETLTT